MNLLPAKRLNSIGYSMTPIKNEELIISNVKLARSLVLSLLKYSSISNDDLTLISNALAVELNFQPGRFTRLVANEYKRIKNGVNYG